MPSIRFHPGRKHPLFGVRGVKHPRARYSNADRERAIDLYRTGEHRFEDVAEMLGCNPQTVSRWWREYVAEIYRTGGGLR